NVTLSPTSTPTTTFTTTTASSTSPDTTTTAPSEECGQSEAPAFRVIGGEESLPGRWPWMAAIFSNNGSKTCFMCGGSLIGTRHVLTAAHCSSLSRGLQLSVRLGDIDLKRDDEPSSPEIFRVIKVRAHPHYRPPYFYNDLAIMVLDRTPRGSRYVMPLCLPPPSVRYKTFVDEMATVVGWGDTFYGGNGSTVQRQTNVPIWRNDECDSRYYERVNSSFICAGDRKGGKDTCQGDSGGPLMLEYEGRWMQIGIVSFGMRCGDPNYPGVYTRVTEYVDWIKDKMLE
ncbi:hypothetical protein L9F63_009153, partial [Diploptera punctata]